MSIFCLQVDDYGLVTFMPLDISEEDNDSLNDILLQVDIAIQYGEDLEPKEPRVSINYQKVFVLEL